MSERCSHCAAAAAERTWDMRPCAIGKNITFSLCDHCDLELNQLVLEFFRVKGADQMLAAYAS